MEVTLGCQVQISESGGSDFDGVVGTVVELDHRRGRARVAYEQWFASQTRYTHGWYDVEQLEELN